MNGVFKWRLSMPFNIFQNKGTVEVMSNESLNQYKFDSTACFQQAVTIFYTFSNLEQPVQMPQTFGPTKCWMHVEVHVELFKWALKCGPMNFLLSISPSKEMGGKEKILDFGRNQAHDLNKL